MSTPTLPTASTQPIHAPNPDQLRERLTETVGLLNAATDPAERVELHLDVVELRALLAEREGIEIFTQ
jgi:hypothetical protein